MQSMLAVMLVLLSTGYGTLTGRHIKALSEEDIVGLREGRGMAMALAAELNHHPGPMHVLELADVLKLTAEQKTAVQAAHDRMKATAVALGGEIVGLERQLDEAFATGAIDEKKLAELTSAIAERQGRLRYAHLAAHITTRAVLSPEQVKMYDEARGYGSGAEHQHHHKHGH